MLRFRAARVPAGCIADNGRKREACAALLRRRSPPAIVHRSLKHEAGQSAGIRARAADSGIVLQSPENRIAFPWQQLHSGTVTRPYSAYRCGGSTGYPYSTDSDPCFPFNTRRLRAARAPTWRRQDSRRRAAVSIRAKVRNNMQLRLLLLDAAENLPL